MMFREGCTDISETNTITQLHQCFLTVKTYSITQLYSSKVICIDIFFMRKRDLEIEERMWSFNTFHQSEVHYRLKVEDETNTLGPKKVLSHQDFGSKRKKRTHRFMSLRENRAMASYSTEFHQLFEHTSESTSDEPKLRCTRHYFLADDTTQDPTQAVKNK